MHEYITQNFPVIATGLILSFLGWLTKTQLMILETLSELKNEQKNHAVQFGLIKERLDKIDQRLDRVDQRFDKVDQRFDKVDQRFDGIDVRLNKMDQRLQAVEIELNIIRTYFMPERSATPGE